MSLQGDPAAAGQSIALTYFNDFQARTVEVIAERVIPGEGSDAGATEAGVVYYIDRTITGFSTGLQRVYRLGLRELEAYCSRKYSGQFVDLTAEEQDEILRVFLGPEVGPPAVHPQPGLMDQDEGDNPGYDHLGLLYRLFAVIREHAIEGYFCDPIYGGNRNTVGWKLVGFPGTQWGYSEEQMKPGYDATRIAIKTLSDLRFDLENLPLKKANSRQEEQ